MPSRDQSDYVRRQKYRAIVIGGGQGDIRNRYTDTSSVVAMGNIAGRAFTALTGPTVPDAPLSLRGVIGDGFVRIDVSDGNDGGSPIIGYSYLITDSSILVDVSESPFTITQLENGRPVEINVKARNAIGRSVGSISIVLVPATVPDPPLLNLTSDLTSLSVDYSMPFDGGRPVTDYYYSIGGTFSDLNPIENPFTISPLISGRTYSIAMKARNERGLGAASTPELGTPLPSGDKLMFFLDAANYSGSGSVWPDSGGPRRNATLVNEPTWSSENGGRFQFLEPQYASLPSMTVDYSAGITIMAFVYFGAGGDGSNWERIIDFGNGQANDNIILSRDGTSNTLTFQIYDGSLPALRESLINGVINDGWGFYAARFDGTSYKVQNHLTSMVGQIQPFQATSVISSNFIGKSNWANDAYFERYMGIVAVYNTALSDADITQFYDLFKERYFLPSAPAITSITPGTNQLMVNFTAPISNSGFPILSYDYSVDNGSAWFPSGTNTSPIIITGLGNGTTYNVVLRAVNSVGAGAKSNTASGTPSAPLTAPIINYILAGNDGAYVYFTPGSGTVTNYKYIVDSGAVALLDPADTKSPVFIPGLSNGNTYNITLIATNGGMDSDDSTPGNVTLPGSVAPSSPNLFIDPDAYSGSGGVTNSGIDIITAGVINNVGWQTGVDIPPRKVFDFNGSTGKITFGNYDFTRAFTLCAWVYPRTEFSINTILANTSAQQETPGFKAGWNSWETENKAMLFERGNGSMGGVNISEINTVTLNSWQLLTYVYDGNNSRAFLFKNGDAANMSSISAPSNVATNNLSFVIGDFVSGGYPMDGQIGSLKVYKSAFNAAQILNEFNSTKSLYEL
jgi:hypothetical protein